MTVPGGDPLSALGDWLKAGRAPQMRYLGEVDGAFVHFTDHPAAVASEGFAYGVADLRKLDNSMLYGRSSAPGFNFAFEADSREARAFAKSAKGCVVFEGTGILVDHMGDGERQVVFWGPHVERVVAALSREVLGEDWRGDDGARGTFAKLVSRAVRSRAPNP